MFWKSFSPCLVSVAAISFALTPMPVPVWAKDCVTEQDCRRQHFQSRLSDYPTALQQARQAKDTAKEIEATINAAEAHQYFGRFQNALDLYEAVLNLSRQSGDKTAESDVLEKMAMVHDRSQPGRGIDFLEQQLQTHPTRSPVILSVLGLHTLVRQNYPATIAAYTRYLAMVGNAVTPERVAVLSNLARAYSSINDFEGAVQFQKQAIAITRQLQGTDLTYRLDRLATLYREHGQPEAAIEIYNQLIGQSLRVQNIHGAIQFIQGMAVSYAALGNIPKTQELFQATLDLSAALPSYLQAPVQRHLIDQLSISHAWSGDYATAIALQKRLGNGFRAGDRGHGFDMETDDIFYEELGAFYLRTGNYTEAEKALRKALVIHTRSRQSDDPNNENLYPSEDASIVGSYDMSADLHRHLQETLIAQNRAGEALEMAEAGRGRAFVGRLAKRLGIGKPSQLWLQPPNLAQIRQTAKAHNATLVVYSTIYADLVGFMDTGLLRLGSGPRKESQLFIWVVKPTGNVVFRAVDLDKALGKQTLNDLVRDSRAEIGVRERGLEPIALNNPFIGQEQPPTAQKLQQLYQLLIQPIAEQLPTQPSDRVIFVPQDALYLVPFAALQAPDGRYLIQSHTILTAPSVQALALSQTTAQRLGNPTNFSPALVVGNPTMPQLQFAWNQRPERLADLPGAEQEALEIAQVLKTKPLIGPQATKANVLAQMPQAKVIHLATHGILDNLQGLQSAIALAPDPNKASSIQPNGFLTASQVLPLQLSASLVVLSACNTGRGEITGDGVIGLARSFLSAGAASVVVSLWAVPDAPTATLMSEFYKTLQQDPDKANALRQAMLVTQQRHPNPRDWAAFTLVGQP